MIPLNKRNWKFNNLTKMALLFGISGFLMLYFLFLSGNTKQRIDAEYVLRTELPITVLADKLLEAGIIKNKLSLLLAAKIFNQHSAVKPGKYQIKPGMSNIQLLKLFRRQGRQEVVLVIRSSWSKHKLLSYLAANLNLNENELQLFLEDSARLAEYGLTPETATVFFVPNNYNFYWNTSQADLMKRMQKEYSIFWNNKRIQKAQALGLSPFQVMTLASIVEKETAKNDEMATIAGVYVNRLKKNMKLQADPTVKFAIGNETLKRIKGVHLDFPSPYNTYLNEGLPPGPICLPSIQAIDAVLNKQDHKYLYFCAKEDLSGYHNFTADYKQHLRNRDKYVFAINKLGIQ